MFKKRVILALLVALALVLAQAGGLAEASGGLINRDADEEVTGYPLYDAPGGGRAGAGAGRRLRGHLPCRDLSGHHQ